MLPLLAVGAGLLMAGKVASDMSEAKKYSEKAKEAADDGNYFLKKAEKYKNELEYTINKASETIVTAKQEGLTCLLENFSYFSYIELKDKKSKYYRKYIEDFIRDYELSITVDEVIETKDNVKKIANKLGIDLDSYELKKDELVEDVAIETFAGLTTHGVLAAGVGGVATLFGAEFLMATGIGALVLAPIMLSVSSDKVDEAKDAYYKASQFKEEAKIEMEKWKGQLSYIHMFKKVADFYHDFIINTINISDYFLEKYRVEPNNDLIITKNLITLAYLNKFIQYQYIKEDESNDLNKLINWVKNNAESEKQKFIELQNEISKIKERK